MDTQYTAMPILWRYLLSQYSKVLLLTVMSLIALLFVGRLEQIARFAASGAALKQIALFALYLIPYVLPIALPIACLLSAILLLQKLSHSSELTALRTAGMSLKKVLTPILFAASLLMLLNFYIASELASHCHLLGKAMQHHQGAINPMGMLRNAPLLRAHDAFVDCRTTKVGEAAEQITIAFHNQLHDRLSLILADEVAFDSDTLVGKNVTVITGWDSNDPNNFDHLALETVATTSSPMDGFAQLMGGNVWHPKNSHLRFGQLLTGMKKAPSGHTLWKMQADIVRRISLALAVLTFTLLGAAFGVEIGRHSSRKGILSVGLLATFFIVCFLVAGGLEAPLVWTASLYLLPHVVIGCFSLHALRRIARGCA